MLRFINDAGEIYYPMTKKAAFRQFFNPKEINIEDYFPSEVERVVGRLARNGWVEKNETKEGVRVTLTENGKKRVWMFDIEKFAPKKIDWDGKWRMVIFDVEEQKRRRRNKLRKYLEKLGFWQMQKSVWICPFDCEAEVKYLREILEIPSEVKWALLEKIENEKELKDIFGLR